MDLTRLPSRTCMQLHEKDFVDLFKALLRRSIWLIILAALGAGAGYFWTQRQPTIYQALAFIELGRIDQEPIEEPHLLAEIVNAPGFLAAQGAENNTESDAAAPAEGKKKKKKQAGGAGRLTAECLETGRKRERIVYLIRLTARSEDKAAARATVEAGATAVIDRTNKKFTDAVKLYRDRETELVTRLEGLRKAPAGTVSDVLLCERELFDVRSQLLPQRTFATQLARPITAPEVISSPQPARNTVLAAGSAFLFGALLVIGLEFIRPAPMKNEA